MSAAGATPSGPWHKTAIVYELDVETFMDGDGDGIGDFVGLTRRLDYLAALGVTCLWLMPFYPSPRRDGGYDIADYDGVDPRFGTLGNFVDFMREAERRGLRVIADLVVNHTSDQHPWFQAARNDPESSFHRYYIWSRTRPRNLAPELVFPGEQQRNWSWDDRAQAWYWHTFYAYQPDLDIANPAVRDEIRKIMTVWLRLGVSGFRIDAAPFLIDLRGVRTAEVADPHMYLRQMRHELDAARADAIFFGEIAPPPAELVPYFGDGDELQMITNFGLCERIFLALAQQTALPIAETLAWMATLPRCGQMGNFLRNHDELSLSGLTADERQVVFDVFAPQPDMRVYHRGIRRRLASMLGGDRTRIELAHSLLLTLPGTPVLFYGEELGMSENLALPDRQSVRTPMPWSPERNGGFTAASRPFRPLVADGPSGYERVNIAAERDDPNSLLNWMTHAIWTRRRLPEFGLGHGQIVETGDADVLAHCGAAEDSAAYAVHNLAADERTVRLDLPRNHAGRLVDVFGNRQYAPFGADGRIALDGFGYRWLRLHS